MTTQITSHEAECETIRRWLFDAAVPFWIEHGIDCNGLAYEELGFDGKPIELGYRRSLVQFRQVYVLARAALMGFGSRALPSALFNKTAAAAWHPQGGFVHKLDTNGFVLDVTRESYDQAFGLLACAWAYAVDRESNTLEYAYRTLHFLDTKMASPHGGYTEATSARLPRRQNPHMHLFEAFLALYEVTGDEIFRSRAEMILSLLERRFIASEGALREYFDDDWRPANGSSGESVEPGHHYEWAWLLHEYARLTGEPIRLLASKLFEFATRHGLDARGRPVAEVDTHGARRRDTVKLWAVTEQLKAHVVRSEAAEQDFDPALVSIVEDLSENFLLREPPLWFEEIAAEGSPSRRRMPASTLYHITSAGAELLRWKSTARSPLAQAILD
jgi:mannose/cellobiose epimerase-like protein (N-acyl-D-glucosamine 2-epimerase family)